MTLENWIQPQQSTMQSELEVPGTWLVFSLAEDIWHGDQLRRLVGYEACRDAIFGLRRIIPQSNKVPAYLAAVIAQAKPVPIATLDDPHAQAADTQNIRAAESIWFQDL